MHGSLLVEYGQVCSMMPVRLTPSFSVTCRPVDSAMFSWWFALNELRSTSEVTERLVYSVLTSGHYGRHVAALAERLRAQQDRVAEKMEAHGLEMKLRPDGGMFAWARLADGDGRTDGRPALTGNQLATLALEHGIWLAPGSYFEPDETDSPWIRFNVATTDAPQIQQIASGLVAGESLIKAMLAMLATVLGLMAGKAH